MKQEAIGVSEFQRVLPFLLFFSSCARLYPSSRLLVTSLSCLYPTSSGTYSMSEKMLFSSKLYVYSYLSRHLFGYDTLKGHLTMR